MAFNVLGDPLKSPHRSLHHIGGDVLSDYLNESTSKPDYISPMDDLAFDMYQVLKFIFAIYLSCVFLKIQIFFAK